MGFYTYLYLRQDGTPYYVGKGSGNRFLSKERIVPVPTDLDRIILEYHSSEKDALEAEKFFIAFYGRKDTGTGCLRNLTDGGDGVSGFLHLRLRGSRRPEYICRKISIGLKNNKNSPGWPKGKPRRFTPERIEKLKDALEQGMTQAQIGRILGVSQPAVHYAVKRLSL